MTAPVADGQVIQVRDHRQRFLGIGFYNSKSKIAVRLIARQRIEVNRDFFEQRFREALAMRQRRMPHATSFRVVNSESDFLSGLIVDKYQDVLVLQISALGMEQRKEEIVAALAAVLSPRAIVERSDGASRRFEGLPDRSGVLAGSVERECVVDLNGLQLRTDLLAGHKTGLYLDQQINYQHVSEIVLEKLRGTSLVHVLDCFSFGGGFALHAARAGASHTLGIEQSAEAVAIATGNAAKNGLSSRCSFETANVFDWLKAQTTAGPHEQIIPRFDLIILDPPSFTRTRAAVPDALRGYKEIHLRALKLLKPGGTLATFCCSHHVDGKLFEQVIMDAACDARRILRRVAAYSQAPDHPVLPAIPETEYLKGFAFEVVEW